MAGKVSLKHIYEIAAIKSQDEAFLNVPLREVCKQIIATAHGCGIKVVPHLDEQEYVSFLEDRKVVLEEQAKKLEEIRQAKMLRL